MIIRLRTKEKMYQTQHRQHQQHQQQHQHLLLQHNNPSTEQRAMMHRLVGSMAEPQMQDIDHPGMNDVMCGRGGGTNNHIGNIRFRQLVNGHKLRYLAATKSEKPMVSREVVTIWRSLNPPGRFLKQKPSADGKSGLWSDVGDKKAREKASQCLRERTADVAPFVKKLELQLSLQEEEEEFKKSGAAVKPKQEKHHITAAELSKELLLQQQEATYNAHMALEAFIPPSMVNSLEQKPNGMPNLANMANNNVGMYQNGRPLNQPNIHGIPPAPANNSLTQQRERLAQEIAQLQQQQAHLEAMAQQTRRQVEQQQRQVEHQQVPISHQHSGQHVRHPGHPGHPGHVRHPGDQHVQSQNIAQTEIPVAAWLTTEWEPNPLEVKTQDKSISFEQYKKSVLEFMEVSRSGKSSKSGKSDSGRSISTIENIKSDVDQKISAKKSDDKSSTASTSQYLDMDLPKGSYDRDSDYETRSQSSWIKGLNNLEDMSMSSSTILSPGNSVKLNFQGDDLEPEPIHANTFHNSRETIHTSNTVKKSAEKSLSSFEYDILTSMVNQSSPVNAGQQNQNQNQQQQQPYALPNIYEDQNNTLVGMPPPRSRLPMQKSNTSMMSSGSRPQLSDHKNSSNISMLSDLTKDSQSSSLRFNKFYKAKSDTSMGMSDNLSDLSEAMGSLDMK
jgi:hypothetical protein